METKRDSKGNIYIEVENLRISYIEQQNRNNINYWPNANVLRIQAYTGKGKSLHKGAEYPVNNDKDIYVLFEAFSKLMVDK